MSRIFSATFFFLIILPKLLPVITNPILFISQFKEWLFTLILCEVLSFNPAAGSIYLHYCRIYTGIIKKIWSPRDWSSIHTSIQAFHSRIIANRATDSWKYSYCRTCLNFNPFDVVERHKLYSITLPHWIERNRLLIWRRFQSDI